MAFPNNCFTPSTFNFFYKIQSTLSNYLEANERIKERSGIHCFFTSQIQANELLEKITGGNQVISEPDRREYGDYQTNEDLADQVVEYAFSKYDDFEFVLEPTCGTGNFILAVIKESKTLKKVVGVEIYQPYIWQTKFKILTHFLQNEHAPKPEIDIIHGNAFEFSYEELATSTKNLKTLIIGNPPWVTNSELGSIDSKNLPKKSNFKKLKGLEALTGKGNFDIGEYISITMLKSFQYHNGALAFLIKNSVIKNLVQDQKRSLYNISQSEKLNIDSKKEFNVSVNASLFFTQLNTKPDFTCKEFDFYTQKHLTTFGWYKNHFVYSTEDYDQSSIIEGKSIFTWRSGVKHDCSKVMELERVNGHFKNRLGEEIELEQNLVYGILKSSDLKNHETSTFRKLTIITQRKIGQETQFIEDKFPLTYQYLNLHKDFFKKRKSSIYKNKPDFSIFGIGEYSFADYKVAISGLYKTTHFTLVKPHDSKPIMLDDTCYFIGFKELKMAQIAHFLVNSELVQNFLKSIIFLDSKRAITKAVLMRIDFEKAFENLEFSDASEKIEGLTIKHWEAFGKKVKGKVNNQIALFQ